MLTIHHLGISQSERIIWLCEELDIPYQLEIYQRDPTTRLAPAAYKALHPLGTAPVITDGDVLLAESGAIMEYIIGRHGAGRLAVPPDQKNYADYLFWFHFANGSLMPSEMMNLVAGLLGGDGGETPVLRSLRARGDRAYALIESRLAEAPYLAGDEFTAADIINVFALTTMRAFNGRDLAAFPNIKAYLARIGTRPAYRRAMAKGDPDLPPKLE